MDLRHLRYFVVVAAERNLSRAAAKLHVAQPALSRQVRDLERELGVALLDRHAKGVVPTMAGETFAQDGGQLLAQIAASFDRAEAAAAGRRGRVVMGTARAGMGRGLPAAVQESIRLHHPEIDVIVQEMDHPQLWDALQDHSTDVALTVSDPRRSGLVLEPLWNERLDRVIVPVSHPLARRDAVRAPDLTELPLLYSEPGTPPPLLEEIVDRLQKLGLRSPVLAMDGDVRAVHLAVAAGRGWTLIVRSRALIQIEGTKVLPIDGLELEIPIGIMWRRPERRPVVRTVVETVIELVRGYPEQSLRPDPHLPAISPRSPRSPRHRAPNAIPPALELRHLRALLAVAATQTIGRAAERLGLTQSALSRQLKELEHAAGLPLLERSSRGVQLTAAGASLAGDCPAVLLSLERLLQETVRAKRGMEGRCVVGAVATAPTLALLNRALTAAGARNPALRVVMEEVATFAQPEALRVGSIDIGLAHMFPVPPPKDGLARTPVIRDRLCLALLPLTHPLAAKQRIKASDLADLPFLFMARKYHPGFYDRLYAALGKLGLTPRVEEEYEALHAVWAITAQGKGWCIGWESQLKSPPQGTVGRRIVGLNLLWGTEMLTRKGDRNPAVRAVASEILSAATKRSTVARAG